MIKSIKKYKYKHQILFWVLASLWLFCLVLSMIFYAVGTPFNDWLINIFTKTHAILFFLGAIVISIGAVFFNKISYRYICSLLLFGLVSFWKVPASFMPGLSAFVVIIIVLTFLIFGGHESEKE